MCSLSTFGHPSWLANATPTRVELREGRVEVAEFCEEGDSPIDLRATVKDPGGIANPQHHGAPVGLAEITLRPENVDPRRSGSPLVRAAARAPPCRVERAGPRFSRPAPRGQC